MDKVWPLTFHWTLFENYSSMLTTVLTNYNHWSTVIKDKYKDNFFFCTSIHFTSVWKQWLQLDQLLLDSVAICIPVFRVTRIKVQNSIPIYAGHWLGLKNLRKFSLMFYNFNINNFYIDIKKIDILPKQVS